MKCYRNKIFNTQEHCFDTKKAHCSCKVSKLILYYYFNELKCNETHARIFCPWTVLLFSLLLITKGGGDYGITVRGPLGRRRGRGGRRGGGAGGGGGAGRPLVPRTWFSRKGTPTSQTCMCANRLQR